MDPYKHMGMDKSDPSALRGQGLYGGAQDPASYYAGFQQLGADMGGMSAMASMAGMAGMAGMGGMGGMGFGDLGGAGMENMALANEHQQNMHYYQEYCRLYIINAGLTTQMKELIAEKNELLNRIAELEKNDKSIKDHHSHTSDAENDKKSRMRRKAAEIERHYKCIVTTCQKTYGAEGSLMQHIRLKHPDVTSDPDWKAKVLKAHEHLEQGDEDEQ